MEYIQTTETNTGWREALVAILEKKKHPQQTNNENVQRLIDSHFVDGIYTPGLDLEDKTEQQTKTKAKRVEDVLFQKGSKPEKISKPSSSTVKTFPPPNQPLSLDSP